jgi:predicted nucleic acid-binding protein
VAVVVDASVAVKWFAREVGYDEARALLAGSEPLLAPDFLVAELASALWVKVRRNEIIVALAEEAIDTVSREQGIRLYSSVPLVRRAFDLGRDLNHSPYDCLYLALAESLDQPVVTADRRFVVAAEARHPRVRFLGQ